MNNYKTLLAIAQEQDINISQAVLLGLHLLNIIGTNVKDPVKKAHEIISEGLKVTYNKQKTVTFAHAVKETLQTKTHRRQRTLSEIQYTCQIITQKIEKFARRKIRHITSNECTKIIDTCFATARQRHKARLILHGIFTIAIRRGWCTENPIDRVDPPYIKETPIKSLNLQQIQKLLTTAQTEEKGTCLAATAIMIYAGVRPQEIQRLSWKHVYLNKGFINIEATHSKTGGSRHITIHSQLKKLLETIPCPHPSIKICPPNWIAKWAKIRKMAGWDKHRNPWIQDCLRHTFASFHLLYFQNLNRLQYEMGHNNAHLLRTRYLNMDGIDEESAKIFWGEEKTEQ